VAGKSVGGSLLAVIAQRALGVVARDRVDAARLVLQGLAEPRRDLKLEPGAALAHRAVPPFLGSGVAFVAHGVPTSSTAEAFLHNIIAALTETLSMQYILVFDWR
jgi:hypothetical protein